MCAGLSPRCCMERNDLHMKKNITDGTRYFHQRDIIRPLSGGVLIAAVVIMYFAYVTWLFYIITTVLAVVALVMFFVGGSRLISENDMQEQIENAVRDYDKPITDMGSYDRVVLRQPAPVETAAYSFGDDATYFKKGKSGTPTSDIYTRAHFFFTKSQLLVIGRRVLLTSLFGGEPETADFSEAYDLSEIRASLDEHSTSVIMTAGGKTCTVKWCELVITDLAGAELLRLPVPNDMDAASICEVVNRR